MPAGTGIVASPATGSLHDRFLQDLALLFQAQNLAGSSQSAGIGQNVYVKSLADDLSDVQLPAILVTTEGGEELLEQESFESRTWGYPAAVLILSSDSPLDPNIRPDFLSWRHALMVVVDELPAKASSYGVGGQLLASTPEVWTLSLRQRSVFEEWQAKGLGGPASGIVIASSFVVIGHANEARSR